MWSKIGVSPLSSAYSRKIVCRFLLVSLKIDAILGEVTFHQRGMKLEQATGVNGLGNAHTVTLTRLNGQMRNGSVLRIKVLLWVLYHTWNGRQEGYGALGRG